MVCHVVEHSPDFGAGFMDILGMEHKKSQGYQNLVTFYDQLPKRYQTCFARRDMFKTIIHGYVQKDRTLSAYSGK